MKLSYLKNTQENRKIRDVVMSAGSSINVYEPTLVEIDEILKLQEKWASKDEIEVSGIDVIKVLFPMLTDLEGIDEMTDEEIREVNDNPTNAFLQIQYNIETIITEIYKTTILKTRKEILDTDLQVEAYKVQDETIERTIALASKNNGTEEVANKLKLAEKSFLEAEKENAESEKVVKIEKFKTEEKESETGLSKAMAELDKYRGSFASTEDRINTKEETPDEDWKGKKK